MVRSLMAAVLTAVPYLAGSVTSAGAVEIHHDTVTCVPLDRYARLSAAAIPASRVARAEIQFRVGPAGGWYSLPMTVRAGEWTGVLPRPGATLGQFEYRIVMTGTDLATVETPARTVRVAADLTECEVAPRTSASVDGPIVVRVPRGAPVVPPVPAGFSPAGVIAATGPVHESRARKVAVPAILAAGLGAGAALAGSRSPHVSLDPNGDLPAVFAITAFAPPDGSSISMSTGRVELTLRVQRGAATPIDFAWRFEMSSNTGPICVVMAGDANVGQSRPATVVLTAPLTPTGACGPSFDVETGGSYTIRIGDAIVGRGFVALRFHFEP